MSTLTRLIYFNPENLEQLQLQLSEIKAYLPIKTFKLRKLFEQFIFLLDGILALCSTKPKLPTIR